MNPTATGKKVLEFMPRAAELRRTETAIKRFSIKAEGPEQPVATLSGGNQQKVAVARWMEANVDLVILEEPTIGVDVGSKAEIYHLLKLSLEKGMAVLLISSDFEEVGAYLPSRPGIQPRPCGGRDSASRIDRCSLDGKCLRRDGVFQSGASL